MSVAAVNRGPRPAFSPPAIAAALVLSLAAACVPVEDKGGGARAQGGSSGSAGSGGRGMSSASGGSAGSGSGGSSASGGSSGSSGSGGETATGGSSGAGSGGSGGRGGATGSGGRGGSGPGGSGGSGSPSGGRDGGAEAGGGDAQPAGTFELVSNNVISNCVFCHPGEVEVVRNSDFADSAGLYDLLVSPMPTKWVSAACAFKRLVVPGKPMESLLYLKLAGTPPAGCGARMPLPAEPGKPFMPIRAIDLEIVRSWIAAGAPR